VSESVELKAEVYPKVLVLLAAYNGRQWIADQVESILQQARVDVRIVIRDDKSTDGTADYIDSLWRGNDRVTLEISEAASGSAGQNFMGLIRDSSLKDIDYVCFSDQDDVWHVQKLQTAIESLLEVNGAGYSCAVNAFWPDNKAKILSQNSNIRKTDYLFEGAGQGCTFVVTVDYFTKLQKFCIEYQSLTDRFYYHDWLIYLLARCWEQKWIFDSREWMSYRQHGENDTGARVGALAIKSRLIKLSNGWYRNQVRTAIDLCKCAKIENRQIQLIDNLLVSGDSAVRRTRLCFYLLIHSRRRLLDRVVLSLCAVLGWI
jgi:rhamnosyltransferase